MKFNPELNWNTILTSIAIAGLIGLGSIALKAKDDITKLTAQQGYLVKAIEDSVPRAEIELKFQALRVDVEAVRVQCKLIEIELLKVKQLIVDGAKKS